MRNIVEHALFVTIYFPLSSYALASFKYIAMEKLNIFQVWHDFFHYSSMLDTNFSIYCPRAMDMKLLIQQSVLLLLEFVSLGTAILGTVKVKHVRERFMSKSNSDQIKNWKVFCHSEKGKARHRLQEESKSVNVLSSLFFNIWRKGVGP